MDWSGMNYLRIIVMLLISCLDSNSDGTHSLQRIHLWWNATISPNLFSLKMLGNKVRTSDWVQTSDCSVSKASASLINLSKTSTKRSVRYSLIKDSQLCCVKSVEQLKLIIHLSIQTCSQHQPIKLVSFAYLGTAFLVQPLHCGNPQRTEFQSRIFAAIIDH